MQSETSTDSRGPGAISGYADGGMGSHFCSERDGKSEKSSGRRGHRDSSSERIPLAAEWGTDCGGLGCVAQDAFRGKQLKPAISGPCSTVLTSLNKKAEGMPFQEHKLFPSFLPPMVAMYTFCPQACHLMAQGGYYSPKHPIFIPPSQMKEGAGVKKISIF